MKRMKSNGAVKAAGRAVFLAAFGIIWCSIVGLLDYKTAQSIVPQIASTWFRPTTARILMSEMTIGRGNKGSSMHGVRFEFAYAVSGTNYTGTLYTFDRDSSSDDLWAREAVAAFPAGSKRICYYDPRNPARAVLAPGLHGSDMIHLMFITPFNILAGFLMVSPILDWRNRRAKINPRFADRLHEREGYATNKYSPVGTFLGVFLFTNTIALFAVAFASGFHPTMAKVVTVWTVAFAIALGASISVYLKLKSGRYDLVFDHNSRTITVPAVRNVQSRETIPMSDVRSFDLDEMESGSDKDRKVTWYVKILTDVGHELFVQEIDHETQAKRLVETLNEKLKA